MSLGTAWSPILVGDDAQLAVSVAGELCTCLEIEYFSPACIAAHPWLDAQFALGAAYGSRLPIESRSNLTTAETLIDRAAEKLASTALDLDFFGGLTGIAWTIQHLSNEFGIGDSSVLNDLDAVLMNATQSRTWHGRFDLATGLVGLGTYALERLVDRRGEELLELVVRKLGETAQHERGRGYYWLADDRTITPAILSANPMANLNIGLAHGVPGAVSLLASTARGGWKREVSGLLEGAVEWVMSWKRPESSIGPVFPTWGSGPFSRFGWCYGDLGVAVCLVQAASALERTDWLQFARSLAVRAINQLGTIKIPDAGLCHGHGGIGHLLNRLGHSLDVNELLIAASGQLQEVVHVRDIRYGVGGYAAWRPQKGGWDKDLSILRGTTGVLLSLQAAVTDLPPNWDRMMLCGLPSQDVA